MSVDDIVNDITGNMASDGRANYIQLTEQIGIIGTIASIILGLIVYIILIGVPLIVAIEELYINFPVIHDKMDKVLIKTTGRLNTMLGLTVHDARLAIQRANTIQTGKSVNYIYLMIKMKAIFLAVLSAGLVLGAGPSVTRLILKIAESIIDGFREVI